MYIASEEGDGGASGFGDNKLDVTRMHLHKGYMCVAFYFYFSRFFPSWSMTAR